MKQSYTFMAFLALMLFPSDFVFGHCDTMKGPVVTAARKALETGDVRFVLMWVQEDDEAQIKEVFQKTLEVRKLSAEAKDLADRYFFETVVRIHRAGEGVAYTGLKSDETEVQPGIEAADQALEKGSVEELLDHVTLAVREGIRERFERAMEKKRARVGDVAAGREFVNAYVHFIHYVERAFESANPPGQDNGGEHIH